MNILEERMDLSYVKTRHDWESRRVWGKPVTEPPRSPESLVEDQVHRLITDTVATGCSLKSAVKWWDYIFRKLL
jgi:hypothetical protein